MVVLSAAAVALKLVVPEIFRSGAAAADLFSSSQELTDLWHQEMSWPPER